MTKEVINLAVNNSTILEKAWIEGSNDFQQRIPNPSVSGYQATYNALFDPMNGQMLNEFANLMVGLMGTYVEGKLFENPLRELKKSATQWGNTERHVAVKYLKAHAPKVDDETLLKLEKPEFREWFYSVNNNRRYEFSWNRYELQRVFSDADSFGYDDLLAMTLTQTTSSDNYDEMNSMIEAFAIADSNENYKLYRHNITAEPTTKETGQELLAKIKADAGRMRFPSTLYNQMDIPVFETSNTLILWVTPEVDANLDVYALAELFNVERAEVRFRKVIIPEFPIPNVCAALTSEDFIYVRDVWYGIEPPFYNPANRSYKYYLYHDQMIGVNPVANCILYTTDAGTVTPTIKLDVTGLTVDNKQCDVEVGGVVDVAEHFELTGTVSSTSGKPTSIKVEPQALTYEVTAPAGIKLNSRTFVDDAGLLHVQKSLDNTTLTVKATSTYINPSGDSEFYTAELSVNVVVPDEVEGAKESFVERNPNLVYTPGGADVEYRDNTGK